MGLGWVGPDKGPEGGPVGRPDDGGSTLTSSSSRRRDPATLLTFCAAFLNFLPQRAYCAPVPYRPQADAVGPLGGRTAEGLLSVGRVSLQTAPDQAVARHGWIHALVTVLAGLIAMIVVAALGLWAAGAADLPDGAFPRVVAATVVVAVGGSIELTGDAGAIAETKAGMSVTPLSVTLAGVLVVAAGFLRPLRHRAVAGAPNWPAGPPGSPSCGSSR